MKKIESKDFYLEKVKKAKTKDDLFSIYKEVNFFNFVNREDVICIYDAIHKRFEWDSFCRQLI